VSEPSTTGNHPLPGVVSRNGELLPPADATISVLGSTLYSAWGVYESMQLWDGVVFHLDAHLDRLFESARVIALPLAAELETHRQWVEVLVAAETESAPKAVARATIRLFAVGPESGQGSRSFIWLTPFHAPDAQTYQQGVGAVTYRGERMLPNAKSLNNLVNTLARHKASAAGEEEGVLVDEDGNVCEGASSNFYVIQDDTLLVPPPDDILSGVTLQIVLRLAEEASIPVIRQKLPLADRDRWKEAFITSTSRHILPLVRLDGTPIGDGRPGPVTIELHRRFEAYFARHTGHASTKRPE
jgi:branched-subunit amino acid aminotransferase/4-amino-4-deoxychorismate lyase